MMRIVDINEEPVLAAAQFTYRGWIISMTSITPRGRIEVLAWKNRDLSANSVEEVINKINKLEYKN